MAVIDPILETDSGFTQGTQILATEKWRERRDLLRDRQAF
jgi:hypothetical protein